MSQNTPRKFSEKIAMLSRKQNEDQEAFRSVMGEVRAITKKTANSPGSSDGSPVGGPPSEPVMGQMGGVPGMPCQPQPHMLGSGLCAGPPHPLASSSMGWNRPGGSLPNVHQMVTQQTPVDYNNWGYWQNQQANHGYSSHTQRTRSPGAPHYHPYRKSNERIPQLDNSQSPNVHLQPPDPSWSNRARSDPTIHMNAMHAMNTNMYYNQWSPEFLANGQVPHPGTYSQQPSMVPPEQMGYSNAHQYTQSQQQQQQQQQHVANYQSSVRQIPQQMGSSTADVPIGSLPNMPPSGFPNPSYMVHPPAQPSTAGTQSTGPMSAGPFPQQQQQLSTPAAVSESQSAPTSPAQSFDAPMQPQWPPTRHYSASPDTMDIPNIVLTGADGTLDCFQDLQDLRLDSDDMRTLLMNDQQLPDPAYETQLLN